VLTISKKTDDLLFGTVGGYNLKCSLGITEFNFRSNLTHESLVYPTFQRTPQDWREDFRQMRCTFAKQTKDSRLVRHAGEIRVSRHTC